MEAEYILAIINLQEQVWELQKENAWLRHEINTLRPPETNWRDHTVQWLEEKVFNNDGD